MAKAADLTTDIAIIGGGLIGSALALVLAGAGFRVVVIDRLAEEIRRDPAFDGRGYAIALASSRLLGSLGLWDDLEAKAEPIRRIEVADAGAAANPLLHFDPDELDERRFGWILEDRYLRQALLQALAETRDITHLAPAEVLATTRDGPLAEITLADGGRVKARLVVACDGRRSAQAAGAGIRRIGWSYAQTGLVAAIAHDLPHEGLAHQQFFPGGPFAVLPLPGNRSSLVWSERQAEAARIAALSDDAYTAEIANRIGDRLGGVRLAGRRYAYPLDLTLAEAYVAPRLALAGDAAHGVHPIAGQGLNMGLRDVAALAETLVDVARIGLDIGARDVLRGYERWRRFDATSMALGMDALNRLFSNRDPVLRTLRDAGLRAVDRLGGLRRGFMREAIGAEGDVPRLLRGEPL